MASNDSDRSDDREEVNVTLIHETDDAWLIDGGNGETWIPKSLATYEDGVLTAPEWLLMDRGLI